MWRTPAALAISAHRTTRCRSMRLWFSYRCMQLLPLTDFKINMQTYSCVARLSWSCCTCGSNSAEKHILFLKVWLAALNCEFLQVKVWQQNQSHQRFPSTLILRRVPYGANCLSCTSTRCLWHGPAGWSAVTSLIVYRYGKTKPGCCARLLSCHSLLMHNLRRWRLQPSSDDAMKQTFFWRVP